MEVNSYDRPWFLCSLAASPLFIAAYLELWSWQASQGRAGAGMLCRCVVWGGLRLQDRLCNSDARLQGMVAGRPGSGCVMMLAC